MPLILRLEALPLEALSLEGALPLEALPLEALPLEALPLEAQALIGPLATCCSSSAHRALPSALSSSPQYSLICYSPLPPAA